MMVWRLVPTPHTKRVPGSWLGSQLCGVCVLSLSMRGLISLKNTWPTVWSADVTFYPELSPARKHDMNRCFSCAVADEANI